MKKKIWGFLFIAAGISIMFGLSDTSPDLWMGVITIGIGLFLLYRSFKQERSVVTVPDVPPLRTFSFQAAGFRFDCRFPNKKFSRRQLVLSYSNVNDTVTLRQYEWEGQVAFALISDRLGADLGVVPAIHVNTVLKLSQDCDVHGKIISLNRIEYKGDSYTACDIELDCFQKSR
mgnify:FL=1